MYGSGICGSLEWHLSISPIQRRAGGSRVSSRYFLTWVSTASRPISARESLPRISCTSTAQTLRRCITTIHISTTSAYMSFLRESAARVKLFFLPAPLPQADRSSLFIGAVTAGQTTSPWKKAFAAVFRYVCRASATGATI